jgi:hypothetical protein
VSAAHPNNDPVEDIGHERRDINVSAVAIFILILELTMFSCCVLGMVFHKGYLYWMKVSAVRVSSMSQYISDAPEPRLQVNPSADMQTYRDEQNALVTSYGWIDTQKGIVRLPIERAKELMAERGK